MFDGKRWNEAEKGFADSTVREQQNMREGERERENYGGGDSYKNNDSRTRQLN